MGVCCRNKRSDFMRFLPPNRNGRRQNSYQGSRIVGIRNNKYFFCRGLDIRVSEIVNAYLLYACSLRKSFVAVLDRCVTQALFSAAHPIGCAETLVFFPTFFMLLQYSEQWNGDLERPNRRFVLRSGFPVSAFQLLRDAAFYGQEAAGYVAPLQGVYFAFPEARIKRNGKEHIVIHSDRKPCSSASCAF